MADRRDSIKNLDKMSSQKEIKGLEKTKKIKAKAKRGAMVARKCDSKIRMKHLVDIFNEHAIENAYITCHNVQDVLKNRGFPWQQLAKKKKRKKDK